MTKEERTMFEDLLEDITLLQQVCRPPAGCGRCKEWDCKHTLGHYGVGSFRWDLNARFARWLKKKLRKTSGGK